MPQDGPDSSRTQHHRSIVVTTCIHITNTWPRDCNGYRAFHSFCSHRSVGMPIVNASRIRQSFWCLLGHLMSECPPPPSEHPTHIHSLQHLRPFVDGRSLKTRPPPLPRTVADHDRRLVFWKAGSRKALPRLAGWILRSEKKKTKLSPYPQSKFLEYQEPHFRNQKETKIPNDALNSTSWRWK